MLGDRLTSDCQARTKKGRPPHSTTGDARASSTKFRIPWGSKWLIGSPGIKWPIPMTTRGRLRSAVTRKRRAMSVSSGFSSSSRLTVRGSSAIPQIGQFPGPARTICGCIGQVHSVFVAGIGIPAGSRAIPHFGHVPGSGWRTSGCIGQVYPPLVSAGTAEAVTSSVLVQPASP